MLPVTWRAQIGYYMRQATAVGYYPQFRMLTILSWYELRLIVKGRLATAPATVVGHFPLA